MQLFNKLRVWCSTSEGFEREFFNQFCDFALLYAWTNEAEKVDEEVVEQVVKDGVFFGGNSLEKELTV
mgnify:CR=1 FL=1